MSAKLALATLLVRDYDDAIAWFTDALGFELTADTELAPGKRWVTVHAQSGSGLLLAKAAGAAQEAAVGNQAGGRVAFFLHVEDFARAHAAMLAKGVAFREESRREAYGMVAVFEDLYGNPWDLIGPDAG